MTTGFFLSQSLTLGIIRKEARAWPDVFVLIQPNILDFDTF